MMAINFINLIATMFGTACNLNPQEQYPKNFAPQLKNEDVFDFIVVGGGSAGCVVAGRLSENPKFKVLLLEAGGYPTVLTEIPGTALLLRNSELDWQYELQPSNNSCLANGDNRCGLARGKVLGGSGSINGMAYLRSPVEDYNRWSALGNVGWDWKNVSYYFKKAENNINQTGDYGPLTLQKFKQKNPLAPILLDSIKEAGFPVHTDEENLGAFQYLNNIENGNISLSGTTAKAYIAKNSKRRNLYVALGALVTKVIIENENAVGVQVSIGGKLINVRSIKEIIVSAGVIASPQFVMLSGIGPGEHLRNLDIPVIKNLQVGNNFHDHLALSVVTKLELKSQKATNYLSDVSTYCAKKTGLLSGDSSLNLMFSHSTTSSQDPDLNIQFTHFPKLTQNYILQKSLDHFLQLKNGTIYRILEYASRYDLLIYAVFLGSPNFRGKIRLRSKDPYDQPLIYPNLLSDREDVGKLKEGIKVVKRILNTPPMREYKAELLNLDLANCNSVEFDSDEFWECYIENLAFLYLHSVGTCKMGPLSDKAAVVDARLRVHGIKSLRVVDGSVIPEIFTRNTNAPIMMIAEKGADMIKEDTSDW